MLATVFTEVPQKTNLKAFIRKIDFNGVVLKNAQRKAIGVAPEHHDVHTD